MKDWKVRPHRALSEFDECLYIDSNLILSVDPADIFQQLSDGRGDRLALLPQSRNSVYEEAEDVIKRASEPDERKVRQQMDHYRARGFAPTASLPCTGFMFRRHRKPEIQSAMERWFLHVMRYARADHLSFGFVAWELDLPFRLLDGHRDRNDFFTLAEDPDCLPPDFDPEMYLWLNPDVRRAGSAAIPHYMQHGRSEGRAYRYHQPIALEQLANKFKSDKGSLYYNAHFYSRAYAFYLSELRDQKFSLLEIGLLRDDVQAGLADSILTDAPSLRMWKSFFPHADIFGFDIGDFSGFEEERCTVIRGDQGNRSDLARALETIGRRPSVIIDDASHASHHQQITLGFLFRALEPGGLFFIEDLRYQPPHLEPKGAVTTLAMLQRFEKTGEMVSPFMTADERVYLEENIDFIRFHDSMDYYPPAIGSDALAVIRKRQQA